jgi:hypothetical protein
MLLVILLFLLTMRGVRIDFSTSVRSAVRGDLTSPVSSPPVTRVKSALSPDRTQEELGLLNRIAESGKVRRQSIRHFTPFTASPHSAPTTPSNVLRSWNTPPPSSLNLFHTSSDDGNLEPSDSEYDDVPTRMARGQSMDSSWERTNEEATDSIRCLTPLSNEGL